MGCYVHIARYLCGSWASWLHYQTVNVKNYVLNAACANLSCHRNSQTSQWPSESVIHSYHTWNSNEEVYEALLAWRNSSCSLHLVFAIDSATTFTFVQRTKQPPIWCTIRRWWRSHKHYMISFWPCRVLSIRRDVNLFCIRWVPRHRQ